MISSIDSVLVRAAASSIASGSPSSERHSSWTLASAVAGAAAARRVNSSTASASASGASSKTRLAVDVRAGPGWCTGSRSPGAASSRRTASVGGRVDDVLAVVEDQQRRRRAGAARAAPPRRRSRSSAAIDGVEHLVGRRGALEPGQPDAARRRRPSARPAAIASAVLPIPPGPTTSTSRSPRAGRTARRARRRARRARRDSDGRFPAGAWAAAGGSDAEPGSWSRTRRSSSRSRGPGLEPELVGQPVADALVGRQRVGLAARAVERGDQQLPQPLLVRMRRDGRLELADDVRRRRAAAAPRARVSSSVARASSSRARCGAAQSPSPRGSSSPRNERERRRAEFGRAGVVAGLEQRARRRGVARARRARRPRRASTASR